MWPKPTLLIKQGNQKEVADDLPELANIGEIEVAEESAKQQNHDVVLELYEALGARDSERMKRLFADDIELWFHGPPFHQHMKRLLTGIKDNFQYLRYSIENVGATVVAEGTDLSGFVFWVHAWTVSDGLITQLREYFNTSLTVTSVNSVAGYHQCVWRSRLPTYAGRSFPGLVLAI
ncbi:hypothetical protein HPP92_013864 [Vanilla planifolia]|uniref:SnoaL-like domain-containing protein n=1 Tax=Vanilla planifolia TaxID=51239 RepID=A0A835UX29_VANPL|nr:hypothetical protein HPP92_013864 [Vanilla planifolia]